MLFFLISVSIWFGEKMGIFHAFERSGRITKINGTVMQSGKHIRLSGLMLKRQIKVSVLTSGRLYK